MAKCNSSPLGKVYVQPERRGAFQRSSGFCTRPGKIESETIYKYANDIIT